MRELFYFEEISLVNAIEMIYSYKSYCLTKYCLCSRPQAPSNSNGDPGSFGFHLRNYLCELTQ